jgi:uncharacterized membrane protein
MDVIQQAQIAPVKVADNLTIGDLKASLAAGWQDFRRHPAYGLFFASIYVVAGYLIAWVLVTRGQSAWLIPAAAGFPLLAPFVAVGLYEVSRRREAGLPMTWGSILGALRGHGDEQLLMMGGFVFVGFAFWIIIAHGIFAIFLAESGIRSESLAFFTTGAGIAMLVVGGAAGAVMALVFYSITVISLPLLVDRDVDFITAIIISLATMRANPVVMIGWAAFIAVALFAAMLPAFLGLFIVLPVLGHATWHLYGRVIGKRGPGNQGRLQ